MVNSGSGAARRFESKRDRWLVGPLWGTVVIDGLAAIALLVAAQGPIWPRAAASALLGLSALAIVSCLRGTFYVVADTELVMRSGPFRRRIPIASVTAIAPTRSPVAAFALSLDRLDLIYGQRGAHVQISPADPAAFVAALRGVNPAIAWADDGPVHA